jgi:hypothetical protein
VLTKAPFHIRRILAGNYTEFLSRFRLLNDVANNAANADDEPNHQSDVDNCEHENATKS